VIKALKEEDEPVFDSPHNSKWVMSVSDDGTLAILSFPNIHDSFLEVGREPEYFGLPDSVDEVTGVYEVICSFSESTDWESGIVDDWNFEIESMKPLWRLE
jgi:hypothetical protein